MYYELEVLGILLYGVLLPVATTTLNMLPYAIAA